jgi:hypothetical protein
VQDRLMNWGYAICDAALRAHLSQDLQAELGVSIQPSIAAGYEGAVDARLCYKRPSLLPRQLAILPHCSEIGALRHFAQLFRFKNANGRLFNGRAPAGRRQRFFCRSPAAAAMTLS